MMRLSRAEMLLLWGLAAVAGCGGATAGSASAGTGAPTGSSGGGSEGTSGESTSGGSEGSSGESTSGGSEGTSGESTSGGSEGTSGESESSGGAAPFVLEVHTGLREDGRLALFCNLPMWVEDCLALAASAPPCEDLDLDGLVDLWEDVALERLRPLRRMDEEEALFQDPTAAVADVGRVAAAGERFRVFVMLGYSKDYGSCGGFTSHNGDSERVALDLEVFPGGGAGGVVVRAAYTAAHEGTVSDKGAIYSGAGLNALVIDADPWTREPRWVVFPSADKHATYASVAICEAVSWLPCFDEDCGPEGVNDPESYDLLPELWGNAGELAAPRISDLTELGFPGDDAWTDADFCGGLGGTGCSSPVRAKLLVDPFEG
jgi:hypothetical protein